MRWNKIYLVDFVAMSTPWICPHCSRGFTRGFNLRRHVALCHGIEFGSAPDALTQTVSETGTNSMLSNIDDSVVLDDDFSHHVSRAFVNPNISNANDAMNSQSFSDDQRDIYDPLTVDNSTLDNISNEVDGNDMGTVGEDDNSFFEVIDDMSTDSLRAAEEFRHRNKIFATEIKLLSLLEKYNVSHKMYDEVMHWASSGTLESFDFGNAASRKNVMIRLRNRYSDAGNRKKVTSIKINRIPSVPVYHFNFLRNIQRLLDDPYLMHDANWHYSHADGYGDLNSGTWWRHAEHVYLRDKLRRNGINAENHYLCPVIAFDDKICLTRKGTISAQPLLISIGNIKQIKRRLASAWFLQGLIPNIPLSSAESQQFDQGDDCRNTKLKLYHDSLRVILGDLLALQNCDSHGRGIKCRVYGLGEVYLHFELCMIIGDTEGHDKMCGHNSCHVSSQARMNRTCDVSTEDGDNPNVECNLSVQSDIQKIVDLCINKITRRKSVGKYRSYAASISQKLVHVSYWDFSWGGCPYGVNVGTPFEWMHTGQEGLMVYLLRHLYDYHNIEESIDGDTGSVTTNVQHLFNTSEFERRVRVMSFHISRQSDRSMPKARFQSGVTTLSFLNAQEYPGLVMLTMVCLEGMLNNLPLEKKFVKLCWWTLLLNYKFHKSSLTDNEVETMLNELRVYLGLYKDLLQDQREMVSAIGLKIPKFHGLLHFHDQIQRYGSAQNFFGCYLESMLKVMIKRPSQRTRKQKRTFNEDLTSRWEEIRCLEMAGRELGINVYDFSDENNGLNSVAVESVETHSSLITYVSQDPHSNIYSCRLSRCIYKLLYNENDNCWELKNGQSLSRNLSFPLHASEESDNSLQLAKEHCMVVGVKSCSIHFSANLSFVNGTSEKTCFLRCNPMFRGHDWYDWVLVKFESENGRLHTVPSRILMLFSYDLVVENEDMALSTKLKVCAVVHPFKEYEMTPYHMLNDLRSGQLNNIRYVVEIDDVQDVALVLPVVPPRRPYDNFVGGRYIKKEIIQNECFLYVPPQSQWDQFEIR